MRRIVAALAAVGVLGALPAAASAHRYTAYAGEAAKPPASAPPTSTLNVFQPAKLKIRAGDKVQYLNNAFHTVSVLAKGFNPGGVGLPVPGATYSGIKDPQGNDFFFNGLQKFMYNPAIFAPAGSTTIGDGKTHSSGAFGGSPAGPGKYTLKFAKPGTYKVMCLLHPGMVQTVKVLKKKAHGADTDAKVRREVLTQTKQHYQDAKKAAASKVPADTVFVGAEKQNTTLLTYLPQTLTVPKGTTVTFANMSPSEVHNMTFGPSDFIQSFQNSTDLFPTGPGSPNQVSPPFVYGSEPTTSPGTWTYSGNEYGDGFFWSPLMDDQPGDPPNGLPGAEKITFDTPGTYTYFCAIHGPDMHGTVIVQ